MKFKSLALLLVVALLITSFAVGCGTKAPEPAPQTTNTPEPVKVGFIYVSPIGDAGWSYAHHAGAEYMKEQLGNVELITAEAVSENPADIENVLNSMVAQGAKIIFATSFGYMDSVIKIAEQYPDVTFLHCSGYKTAPNVGTYFGRIYQARYLSGLVAGKMTTSNTIGYVAAHPIPEVIRGINAFTLGVRAVNPDAVVKVVWTNTWYDPAKEKDAAKSLLDAGADVIAQHQDTPGPQQAAEEAGKYSISYNTDMTAFAPNAVLTGPVWNWGPYYVRTVQAVLDGTWQSEQYWGPMSDDIVRLAPFNAAVPADVVALVEETKTKILNKEWDVFTGPINAQDGTEKVPAGTVMSDADMLSFDWFVEGVEGTIK